MSLYGPFTVLCLFSKINNNIHQCNTIDFWKNWSIPLIIWNSWLTIHFSFDSLIYSWRKKAIIQHLHPLQISCTQVLAHKYLGLLPSYCIHTAHLVSPSEIAVCQLKNQSASTIAWYSQATLKGTQSLFLHPTNHPLPLFSSFWDCNISSK